MAWLVYRDLSTGKEQRIEIGPHRPTVVIGRNEDCALRTADASVSRYHVVIQYHNGIYTVNDPPNNPRAPTNGTFVNGQRKQFRQPVQLHNRYEVRCGKFPVYFLDDGTPSQTHAPTHAPTPTPTPTGHGHAMRPSQPKFEPPPGLTPNPAMPSPGGYSPPPAYPQPATIATMPAVGLPNPELEKLRKDKEDLQTKGKQQAEQIEKLRRDLYERERALAELERRGGHHDVVVSSLNEQLQRLKEQSELQKEQVDGYRTGIKERDDRIEDLEFRYGQLKDQLNASSKGSADNENLLSDLKIQVNQRDRRIEELNRELNLAQYEGNVEKENVQRLEASIARLNTSIEEAERHRKDLQSIIEQQEATISDLRSGRM